MGIDKVNIFYDIVDEITKFYDMEQIWNNGGKKWTYEYKYCGILLEYKFNLENANLKGKWIGIFRELENGSIELDFTEEIEVDSFIMELLTKPYLKSQQKRYMRDLEKELNK